ncbi:hypothetical protein V5O48_000878 [Marasmius crinis-equi]|uniref:AMP-dependent synthetase/ligase domain-containing protein n=1 Tax=Marasmius crinis-equi TaxID=585013 RepID=A0ABR3G0E7_9AGAR
MADLICPTKNTPDRLPLPPIPDNVTLAQFILEGYHSFKPHRDDGRSPGLIEEKSGRMIGLEEVRGFFLRLEQQLTALLATLKDSCIGVRSTFRIRNRRGRRCPNHVEYPVLVWAVHYLGATVTLSNPNFTADELSYHIRLTQPTLIIAHFSALQTAQLCVARSANLGPTRVIALEPTLDGTPSIVDLIRSQKSKAGSMSFHGIRPREGLANKVAALCLSSGTTGLPKVVRITHRAFMANIIQMATHTRIGPGTPGLRPGDIALGRRFPFSTHKFLD